jgi:hypothetical protein
MEGHLTAYTMTLFNEQQSVADAALIVLACSPAMLDTIEELLSDADGLTWTSPLMDGMQKAINAYAHRFADAILGPES